MKLQPGDFVVNGDLDLGPGFLVLSIEGTVVHLVWFDCDRVSFSSYNFEDAIFWLVRPDDTVLR